MYAVALTRWGPPHPPGSPPDARPAALVEELATALAPHLGRTEYDLRLLLAGALPNVLLRTAEVPRAQELLGVLRAAGHGAVACDLDRVAGSGSLLAPRDFVFEADGFSGTVPGSGPVRLEYAQVLALVRATHDTSEEITTETKEKKLSLARAAVTGGLSFSKTTTRREHSLRGEREQVLYVFTRSGEGHLLLREQRLRYAGLGERVGRTLLENFNTTVELFCAHAPAAHYDDRLMSQRRRESVVHATSAVGNAQVATTNAAETDLAAHLIAVACLQGQL
jgi:hypothetical protein